MKKIEGRVKEVCKIFSIQNQLHETKKVVSCAELEEMEKQYKDSVYAAVVKANLKKRYPAKAIALQDIMADEIACLFNLNEGNGKKSFLELLSEV